MTASVERASAPRRARGGRGRRVPKRIGPRYALYLERAAEAYLAKFSTSVGNLRAVLMRRVDRSARFHGADEDARAAMRAEGARLVEDLLVRKERAGLVSDRGYAEAKARSLQTGGASRRAALQKLALKRVPPEIAAAAIDAAQAAAGGELRAAATHARKRRLGPWSRGTRGQGVDWAVRGRELASFARAGFPLQVAKKILDCRDPAEADRLVADAEAA